MDQQGGAGAEKRGRGRPRGKSPTRWAVRAAILEAKRAAQERGAKPATNADVIAILLPGRKLGADQRASLKRAIQEERAAMRHGSRHPSNPFAGFFHMPMPTTKGQKEAEEKAERMRAIKNRQGKKRYAATKRAEAEK